MYYLKKLLSVLLAYTWKMLIIIGKKTLSLMSYLFLPLLKRGLEDWRQASWKLKAECIVLILLILILFLGSSENIQADQPTMPQLQKVISEYKSSKWKIGVNLDRLAYAVAMAETANCTKGYGKEYSNCMGIKNGSIAPCDRIGRNRMCIYDDPSQSYEAFKKIWTQGYGGKFPTLRMAEYWTGKDNANTWLRNVKYYYD